MSDHTVLKEDEHYRYGAEGPVVLENMRLCYHSLYGVNVLQLTFRNVTGQTLYELGIHIEAFDKDDHPVLSEPLEYNYYGIEVENGALFGEKEDIVMETEAVRFEITVCRAELMYGKMFRGDVVLKEMPEPKDITALGEFSKPFQKRYKALYPNVPLVCAPENEAWYWRCTCGHIYSHAVRKCPECGVEHDAMLNIVPELEEEKRRKLEYEAEQERIRQEEEARLALEAEKARIEEERKKQQQLEMERLAEEKAKQIALENEQKRKEELALSNARKKKLTIAGCGLVAVLVVVFIVVKLFSSPKDEGEITASIVPSGSVVADEASESIVSSVVPSESVVSSVVSSAAEPAADETYGKSVAVIGEDITGEDRRLVLRLIGMDEDDFQNYVVVTVTNKQEHEYLDDQLGAAKVGKKSLSCLLITPTAPGSGINISMYNINYCTEEMYRQALEAAGIKDADVYVAAPYASAGTSALTGIYLVPEYMK